MKKRKQVIWNTQVNIPVYNPPFDEDEFKYPVGRKNECESCGGHGFIIDRRRQHLSTIIDVPYTKCKNCHGTGEMEE